MRPVVPLGILGLLIAVAMAAALLMDGGSEQAPGQGYQWVGLRHAAIRVPASWTSDPDACPTGQDQPAQVEFTQRCGTGNAYGDRVVVQASPGGGPIRLDFNADPDPVEKLEVDGIEVLHMGLGCQRGGDYAHTCFDALYVPSEDAYFILQSDEHGSHAINRLIHGLTILPQSLGLD
jgi:hypothetical protein